MKKYIVLVVTTLILTGLAGCSMTKNRYNHYGVVKYLENKYDDKFEYYETYGGTLFDSDPWKGFICTSEKYPGKHILVIYDVKYKKYHDGLDNRSRSRLEGKSGLYKIDTIVYHQLMGKGNMFEPLIRDGQYVVSISINKLNMISDV